MMTSEVFDIQGLMRQSGVPRRTIHFYVQQGILPPPQGAGLAAHYTEDHLLRLRLIPVLREQGLRLDQIRQRFAEADTEALRRALEEATQLAQAKRPSHGIAEDRPAFQPGRATTPVTPLPPAPMPPFAPGFAEERTIQYRLPGGITVTAPENLNPTDRQRLNLLLESARRIFAANRHVLHQPGSPTNGNDPTSTDSSEENHA